MNARRRPVLTRQAAGPVPVRRNGDVALRASRVQQAAADVSYWHGLVERQPMTDAERAGCRHQLADAVTRLERFTADLREAVEAEARVVVDELRR